MNKIDLQAIENKIDYIFTNKNLLRAICSHKSTLNEQAAKQLYGYSQNELAFNGDALILFYSRIWLENYPFQVINQSCLANKMCSNVFLSKCVHIFGLLEHVTFNSSLNDKSFHAHGTLFEALVYGLYLDGGEDVAKRFYFYFMDTCCQQVYFLSLLKNVEPLGYINSHLQIQTARNIFNKLFKCKIGFTVHKFTNVENTCAYKLCANSIIRFPDARIIQISATSQVTDLDSAIHEVVNILYAHIQIHRPELQITLL
jgi:hypothetical protein